MKAGYLFAGLALFAMPAWAKDSSKPMPRSEFLQKVVNCRAITDSTQRLACYDAEVARLDEAATKNEVYMVDKQQVQKTRRTLFGLPLPNLGLFGGGDDDNEENQIAELESTVKSASYNGEGWVITIAEGSTWQQMDFSPLALSPKPGMPVVIKRAALGTYKMSVRKQPGIKVKRIY
ncbi:MAG: hypothetical protein IPK89_03780 [Sphingomonadales bacterium]|nr:hypothetical protein [Sphingomonadales bacterium]MBL0001291.1 hypothetical protein [Sphingomonadales bacterium]MBL0114580.1 hypothetical protein [Sphingomonadales bacterium]MBP7136421.1 hypothetical protein [Sphingomonadaceae bacterium]